MRSNCGMCGGLIRLSTREYPDHDVRPGLFQLMASCEDCGRTSTYDCAKPGPEKFIEKEPDEALYKKAVEGIHKRRVQDPQAELKATIERIKKEQEPDNVIPFTGITRHDVSPWQVVGHLRNLDLMEIVAVGFLNDGSEFFSSSKSDGAAALWHLSRAQHKLMTYADVEGEQS